MASPLKPSIEQALRERAERNLGSLVIAIEFTLISVMVGVILFPLMDFATPILRDLKFEYMLYIVSGLVLILYLWTEVIAHSLSFIGWPIDIFHNLLYIVFAMVLAIQMHFLQDPLGWYAMTAVSAMLGATIVYYDLRIIEERRKGTSGQAATSLFDTAWQRQHALLRTAPFTIGNALLQVALVFFLPIIFIEYKAHLVLIIIQIGGFIFLLRRTITAFKGERETIVQKAIEELASEQE
ncbi:MAG TPA: hypothetical protein VFD70_17495 [Anaerolineae bacterium]|nr:hypothetical protein [Anaerolineae bacterium]